MKPRFLWRFAVARSVVPALCALNTISATAQGTVLFDTHLPGELISHVYLPLPTSPGLVQIGNGTADYPTGTTDWTGWAPVSGVGFSAQLFAAPGADAPVDSLAPAFPITTFHTGAGAGLVVEVVATLTGVPWFAPVATVQMRVWDNRGGSIPDWTTALAQPAGTELLGLCAPINVANIGGGALPNPPGLDGLQSFNLYYVPEPSPLALAGCGALLLIIGRGVTCCGRRLVGRTGSRNPDVSCGMDIYVAKVRY
jgi:hypothetical protein